MLDYTVLGSNVDILGGVSNDLSVLLDIPPTETHLTGKNPMWFLMTSKLVLDMQHSWDTSHTRSHLTAPKPMYTVEADIEVNMIIGGMSVEYIYMSRKSEYFYITDK